MLDTKFFRGTIKVTDRIGTDDMIESANRNFLYPLEAALDAEPEPDHVEGIYTADIYEDLYDILIRMCFLEKGQMLFPEEVHFLTELLRVVHDFNEDWMDVIIDVDDSDGCFDDGFSDPENMDG